MTLEAEMVEFIRRSEAVYEADAVDQSIPAQREIYNRLCAAFTPPRPKDLIVEDRSVPGPAGQIPVRMYRRNADISPGLVLYFHGGGYVVGGLDSHDFLTAWLAQETRVPLLSVDYRLAPEHKFPSAHEDCHAVLKHVRANPAQYAVTAERIILAGDSAGANLAAGIALANRDQGGAALAGQLLVYGRYGWDYDLPSYTKEAEARMLTTRDVQAYRSLYCGEMTEPHPYANPLTADDHADLPEAVLLAAEHDQIRDDSQAYHEALVAAGGASYHEIGPGLVHGSLRAMHTSPGISRWLDMLSATVKRMAGKRMDG